MPTLLTAALIDRCHAAARAKGFWDTTPPKGQQLMLVISELSKTLEADRKAKRSAALVPNLVAHFTDNMGNPESGARTLFENTVKDTVEDKLADAYIRLCDFAGGYQLSTSSVLRHHAAESAGFDLYPDNFPTALLGATMLVCSILDGESEGVGSSLALLEYIAEQEKIDLATHIDLKLRYNATRPYKHAKPY